MSVYAHVYKCMHVHACAYMYSVCMYACSDVAILDLMLGSHLSFTHRA